MAGERSHQCEGTWCRARGRAETRGGGVTAGGLGPPRAALPSPGAQEHPDFISGVPSTSSHTTTVEIIQGTLLLTHLNYFSS